MKKTFALIIIGLVLVMAVCAATSTKFTKYGNIFKSGEYVLKGTSYSMSASGTKTGTGSPLLVAEHAGQYYMEATEGGESMRALIQDGKIYFISDAEKSIMTMTSDGNDDVTEFPTSYEVQSSGKANLDGKSYNYEKAKETDGTLTTYWYNGNDLYAIQSSGTIIYIDSISQKPDASLFKLPTGYTTMDLSSLFSDWGSSDDSWGDWGSSDDYSSGDYSYSDDDWSAALAGIDWENLFGDWDFDYGPHYYAFGILMGLNSTQAKAFDDAMSAFNDVSWDTLNDYYDSSSDKYDLKGQRLSGILQIDNDTMKMIQNLTDRFKK